MFGIRLIPILRPDFTICYNIFCKINIYIIYSVYQENEFNIEWMIKNKRDFKMQFINKVMIITGASCGIGAAVAEIFAEKGATVYNLDFTKPLIHNKNIHWIFCDVTNSQNVADAIGKVLLEQQSIDYLFANAGVHDEIPLTAMSDESIDKLVNTNLKGVVYILRAVLTKMRAQKYGNIVLMGSEQSLIGRKNNSLYGATKGAIAQLTKSLAIEYAEDNIRVNAVCPGAIMTQLTKKAIEIESKRRSISYDVVYKEIIESIPLKRFGTAQDVAFTVNFLCSDEASFITGSLFTIDGGVVAG